MPKVGGMLPCEQGMNWKQYLGFGHDEYSKHFDYLWQSGPFDVQDHAEDPPKELEQLPSFHRGSQFPRYEAIRRE
eukprot:14730372-Alexandrium_andersonii.AAC.1